MKEAGVGDQQAVAIDEQRAVPQSAFETVPALKPATAIIYEHCRPPDHAAQPVRTSAAAASHRW